MLVRKAHEFIGVSGLGLGLCGFGVQGFVPRDHYPLIGFPGAFWGLIGMFM